MLYAALTGDLVQSTHLPSEKIDAAMALIARVLLAWDPKGGRFTRYRGDGWQALILDPSRSLEIAVVVIATLRAAGFATRISIGVGEVESQGTADLSDARGTAFNASGHALDQMHKVQTLVATGTPLRGEDKAIVVFLEERISRWSREQAEAVARAMDPSSTTAKDIAKDLGITPQAMSDRLGNAGYATILYALKLWRDAKIEQGWAGPQNA